MPIAAAVLALLLGLAAPTPDLFDSLFARAQERNRAVRTVHAAFVETTTSALLRDPIVSRGTLVAEMPGRLRLEYAGSDDRVVLVDEHTLVIRDRDPAKRITRDITTAQRRVQKYFAAKSPAELRKHFTIGAAADKTLADTHLVVMVPTQDRIRSGLVELRLWIDERTLFIRQMEMVFPGRETKTFALSNVRLDQPVPPGTFNVR
jgi:outer membrane lipoprotein-sorting protein